MSIFSLDTSTDLAQVARAGRRDQFGIGLPLSPPSDCDAESPDSHSLGVTHILEFPCLRRLKGRKKRSVGIRMKSSLCESGPVVLHRGICPFREISYQ